MYRFEITFLFWRVLFGHFNCVLFGDLELKQRICLRFLKTAPDSSFHNITLSIWMNVKQAPDKSSPVNLNKAKIAKKLWAYGDKSTANGKLGSYKITRGSFFSWDHSWKITRMWFTIPAEFCCRWYFDSKKPHNFCSLVLYM